MVFEKLRFLVGVLLLLAAGAIAASAMGSARAWMTASVFVLAALASLLPLARARLPASPLSEPPRPPDARRLSTLQVQLEHLPIAAWLQTDTTLEPLTSRARRLCAPGGVRDREVLNQRIRTHERDGPLTLDTERGSERWQLQRQTLAVEGQQQSLITLTPLEQELESESLQVWQQLLRVLTHEIMNSLTPIKSLSETAGGLLSEPDSKEELRTALDAIARRADSLSSFVSNYRKVSQWPPPTLAPVDLSLLFKRLQQAVGPRWRARGGEAHFEVNSPGLRLMADEGQLEQMLLALFHNAEQATAHQLDPTMWVQARPTRGGRLQISVRDNGPGVAAGLERQIFLPFFSTREGGQGIGLTVVRQLMFGMGGRVRHVRPLEKGAMFVLIF
jgi:C4-dicarboxylate-specific signal transduction histidine kinase